MKFILIPGSRLATR